MSRTLYILDDKTYRGIDEVSRRAMLEEIRHIFKFVSGFNIKPTPEPSFPRSLDMSDAVVRITQEDGGSIINTAWRAQYYNVRKGVTKAGFRLPEFSLPGHWPGHPERHGSAFHAKQAVPAGKQKLAIPYMAGWVSVGSIVEEVDTFGKDHIRPKEARGPNLAHRYWGSSKGLIDTAKIVQLRGRYLGRAIAHEARHEYILTHAADGLGMDSPNLEKDVEFSRTDRANILTAVAKFETDQKGAILIELWPKAGNFPF